MSSLPYEALIPLVFPFFFAAIWLGVVSLLSLVSGWRGLAGSYRTELAAPKGTLSFRTGRLNGLVNYNSVLSVGAAPGGLYLAVFFLFRPGHAPLLIPWSRVKVKGERRLLFITMTQLEIDDVSLSLATDTWKQIRASPFAQVSERHAP